MVKKRVKKADENKQMDVCEFTLTAKRWRMSKSTTLVMNRGTRTQHTCAGTAFNKTGFLRELRSMFPEPKPSQSKSLQDFQSKNGPLAGQHVPCRRRCICVLREAPAQIGRNKSKARVETEKRWESEGGIQRDRVTVT